MMEKNKTRVTISLPYGWSVEDINHLKDILVDSGAEISDANLCQKRDGKYGANIEVQVDTTPCFDTDAATYAIVEEDEGNNPYDILNRHDGQACIDLVDAMREILEDEDDRGATLETLEDKPTASGFTQEQINTDLTTFYETALKVQRERAERAEKELAKVASPFHPSEDELETAHQTLRRVKADLTGVLGPVCDYMHLNPISVKQFRRIYNDIRDIVDSIKLGDDD
jgi:hypothetical protein